MAEGFVNVPPMHAFYAAMYNDHWPRGREEVRPLTYESNKEMLIQKLGRVPTPEEADKLLKQMKEDDFPNCQDVSIWYTHLARVSAGDFTNSEWTMMCALTSLEMHGADLAALLPRSWVA
jgi:hypothetical protein